MKLWILCEHYETREKTQHGVYEGRERVAVCPGGHEPSNDELIAELERRGVVGFVEWVGETP